jgi:hypothetical protein
LSVAVIETSRLLPVHVPLDGLVMAAVGAVVSPDVVVVPGVAVVVGDVVVVVVLVVGDVVVEVVLVVGVVTVLEAGAPDAYTGLVASL